ncbi:MULTISPECIES: glycogen debranching enzyme [unclassified Sphingomonas]|uniref:glycogen debranching protein n=1 Tax=unclassified Sphingomonas TaxID=196159 RepID=UPI002269B5CA
MSEPVSSGAGGDWGVRVGGGVTRFAVRAPDAAWVALCLFDGDRETRIAMARRGDAWVAETADAPPGTRYGYRADGAAPGFDPAKLLVDPHATELDRRFAYDPRLGARGVDTAALVPKAIVPAPLPATDPPPPIFAAGGLIYELNVRGYTMRHPDVPPEQRGTLAALAHPGVIAHLQRLKVAAVELMPIVAWIDERHLPPLGLVNAWGYNPVVPMALDPGLVPGGVAELRATVAALRAAGIGTILDLVFNHSGESDEGGPTLSFRGLDDRAYRRGADGALVNDSGTGNTLDFAYPPVRALTLAALRHFARAGVDGFRFDLAPILARGPGFDAHAPLFAAIAADPLLARRVMIAEPWDIGPGGYRLGAFPETWLEWNDRYRDDVRRFWRGDGGAGAFATRIAGSADIFRGAATRSVNFIAAHDGFTLADLVAHERRHNAANGEDGRDGHGENWSWNGGAEGASDDPAILARRDADRRALLATLFASKGTIMLAAGDEFGRTQGGNNNAYAQDNATGWVDWAGRDTALEAFVAALAAFRAGTPLADPVALEHGDWRDLAGRPMTAEAWDAAQGFELRLPDGDDTLILRFDRPARRVTLARARILDSRAVPGQNAA